MSVFESVSIHFYRLLTNPSPKGQNMHAFRAARLIAAPALVAGRLRPMTISEMRARLTPRRGLLLFASIAAAAALAGCGGYSSSAKSSGSGANAGAQHESSSASSATGGIPQNNGGDHDADNNGGPSDGDGQI